MASNGRLPASVLARIPGSGPFGGPRLRKDAARAYNAMAAEAMVRWGIDMSLSEGDIGRSYRNFHRQEIARAFWCGLGHCENAAVPGTSNHGWGLAVDLMNRQQRWVIDKIGRFYGFSKSWSDAPKEWWHIKYRPGVWKGRNPFPTLRRGSRKHRVRYLQWLLIRKGYKKVPHKKDKERGHFGKRTQDAVKAFQRKRGLVADGIVGPRTWRALRH